jgi:hypothetical protein
MRFNIRPYSELRIVLAATEQEAYNFVYKGESKEEFFFWLQLHDPKKLAKYGWKLEELLCTTGH